MRHIIEVVTLWPEKLNHSRISSNREKKYSVWVTHEKVKDLYRQGNDSNIITLAYSGKFNFNELKEKHKFLRINDSIEELSEFLNK